MYKFIDQIKFISKRIAYQQIKKKKKGSKENKKSIDPADIFPRLRPWICNLPTCPCHFYRRSQRSRYSRRIKKELRGEVP